MSNVTDWRWRLTKAGHTQKSFSESLGINPQQFSDWVTEKVTPSQKNYERVEKHLKSLGV